MLGRGEDVMESVLGISHLVTRRDERLGERMWRQESDATLAEAALGRDANYGES